jgi:DNA primase large subunit
MYVLFVCLCVCLSGGGGGGQKQIMATYRGVTSTTVGKQRWIVRVITHPITFHATRTLGTLGIIVYYLGYADVGENNFISDLRIWARQRVDNFMSLTEEEKQMVMRKQSVEKEKTEQI